MKFVKTICFTSQLVLMITITLSNKQMRKCEILINKNSEKILKTCPTVIIQNSTTVIGDIYKTIDENKTYYSFRGIPFAQPPIGNLRFRPPVPLSYNHSQTINALKDASPCVQTLNLSIIGSEDCLYLSIYTPRLPHSSATLLPVMVWIYGGAFINGAGIYKSYGPDYLLDEGVMVVMLNYRLGIFGFLSTEDYASPGNYGFKDQLLALKWIRENIIHFGGNPDRITVFGESAGAVSISYLSQTPLTKGLFHGAIMESGTSLNLWALTRNSKSVALTTGKLLHVNATNSETLVDELRKIEYKKLEIIASATNLFEYLITNPLNGLPFGPTIEPPNSDAIITNKSYDQLNKGFFHNIPYIIGYNSLEAIPFVEVLDKIRLYLLKYDLFPFILVPASMNIDNPTSKLKVNSIIKSYYYGFIPVTFSQEALLQYISDDAFVRPILKAVQLYSYSAPVYLYTFSYNGPLGSENNTTGVGHAEELPYLWRTTKDNATPIPQDLLTRRRMTKMWTNFAKFGNPTPNEDPLLQNITWPLTTSAGAENLTYLDINKILNPSINPNWRNFQFWNELFNGFGNPPYGTY